MVRRKPIIVFLLVVFLLVLSLTAKFMDDGISLNYYPLAVDVFVALMAILVPRLLANTPGSMRR